MNDKNGHQPGKKTETIEVRLPFETKRALLEKSQREGQSMSDVIRVLIDQYLDFKVAAAKPYSVTRKWFSIPRKRTVGILAAITASIAIMFSAITPSLAGDIELSIGGFITKGSGDVKITKQKNSGAFEILSDEIAVIKLNNTITADYGKPITIRHAQSETSAYILEFTTKPVENDQLYIAITIKYNDSDGEKIIASPSMVTGYGKRASISVSAGAKSESVYSINIVAKKI